VGSTHSITFWYAVSCFTLPLHFAWPCSSIVIHKCSLLCFIYRPLYVVCRYLKRTLSLLLLQVRTQTHLGCCLAAAVALSAIFMQLCPNSATPYTSRHHMRSCNDVNGNCANRRSCLTTAVDGHEKSRWASSSTGRSCIPKAAHHLQPHVNQTTP
jgi:hypothetical protein